MVSTALSYLPCCISCSESEDPEPDGNTTIEDDTKKLEPGTYTFTVSPFKGKWEAGDKIYVHGSYSPKAQIITLSSGDISADGKTASATLGEVTEYFAEPDGLYAAWPADAVTSGDIMTDNTTSFDQPYQLIMVAYLSGTNFSFVDASSLLTFKAPGYSSYILAGNARPGVNFSQYTVTYSSDDSSFINRKDMGNSFLEGTLTGGEATLWFPGTMTFKGGFQIFLGNDGEWPVVYTVTEDTRFKAGVKIDLGDISSSLSSYEGPGPNMPKMGSMTKYSVKLNELSGLCVSSDASFLWGLGDGSELARISLEGNVLDQAGIYVGSSSIDSEGISVNYDTGDLLISGEPNGVYRILSSDIDNIFKESKFKNVQSLYKIADGKNFGNAGLEGCTYYKDGLLYTGAQTGSYLYCSVIETGEVLWRKPLREMFPVITEIAGLSYDPLLDWLWVVDSESHKFFALTGDAEHLLGAYSLKTKSNEESICVDHVHSCVWIGDDYGSTSYIYKYDFTGLDDYIIK